MRVQNRQERQLVWAVILPLATIAIVTLVALFWQGRNGQLLWLGIVAGVAFAVQVLLKKIGRAARMASEMAGALVLTSTAPAAYCVATGRLDARTWALWLVNWLFAADQVHFVWLRIRGARAEGLGQKLTAGWSFLAGNIFLCGMLALACHFNWLPRLALIAFAPVLLRGLTWFAKKPGPIVVRQLGWTEMAHAVIFAILLIAGFTFAR